jgi:hypothetical protein
MKRINAATAAVLGMALVSFCTLAAAQTGGSVAASTGPAGIQPMEVPPVSGASNDSRTHAVLRISSVEILRSAHTPYLDIIRVRGLASSSGWEEAELVPLTRGVPADGMLQLILVARPPEVAADATGYESLEAIFPLETDHPFKGVNVHSASNAVTVTSLPGYAEAKALLVDCGKCVGKTLVSKGSSASDRGDAVREDQLPPDARIVRPSEGMPGTVSNPNRLTLILDKDSRIVAAVWE